ncbi:hypothetical protein M0813_25921 [Anaeramoeba flamelloides]|uniref:SCP domain-containing protein n=1 Tax=Anaeramoeba flamelloides TaxID=1746091 RepID=A0ABQ8Y1Q0_9EUKA|nr:hypothetical protein M0813_25921 [Anaeramoeba flamelloides]
MHFEILKNLICSSCKDHNKPVTCFCQNCHRTKYTPLCKECNIRIHSSFLHAKHLRKTINEVVPTSYIQQNKNINTLQNRNPQTQKTSQQFVKYNTKKTFLTPKNQNYRTSNQLPKKTIVTSKTNTTQKTINLTPKRFGNNGNTYNNRRIQKTTKISNSQSSNNKQPCKLKYKCPKYQESNHNREYSHPVFDPLLMGKELLILTNTFRKSKKLPPLQWNDGLFEICMGHALDQARKNKLSHENFDQRFEQWGGNKLAENVAFNYNQNNPLKSCVDGWIKSDGHRKNMMGDFTVCAIGLAMLSDKKFYFCQLFG